MFAHGATWNRLEPAGRVQRADRGTPGDCRRTIARHHAAGGAQCVGSPAMASPGMNSSCEPRRRCHQPTQVHARDDGHRRDLFPAAADGPGECGAGRLHGRLEQFRQSASPVVTAERQLRRLRASAYAEVVGQLRVELRPTTIKPLALRLDGRSRAMSGH